MNIHPSTLCRISGSRDAGVIISLGARPQLIGNEVFGNGRGGFEVRYGGDPYLSRNTIRDHAGAEGAGVRVCGSAHGRATILSDNVFLRNEGEDIEREPEFNEDDKFDESDEEDEFDEDDEDDV